MVKITLPADYPYNPPKMELLTKIKHMRVSSNGSFELYSLLREGWSLAKTLRTVFMELYWYIIEVNVDDPFIPALARLYKTDREEHD